MEDCRVILTTSPDRSRVYAVLEGHHLHAFRCKRQRARRAPDFSWRGRARDAGRESSNPQSDFEFCKPDYQSDDRRNAVDLHEFPLISAFSGGPVAYDTRQRGRQFALFAIAQERNAELKTEWRCRQPTANLSPRPKHGILQAIGDDSLADHSANPMSNRAFFVFLQMKHRMLLVA
jgi:hypothetical protein